MVAISYRHHTKLPGTGPTDPEPKPTVSLADLILHSITGDTFPQSPGNGNVFDGLANLFTYKN